MGKKGSKEEIKNQIEESFKNITKKSSKEIKKIKKLAMSKNIPLKEKRKLFCKKCFSPFINPKIRIKKNFKIVKCSNCGYISRWKI